MAYAVFLPYFWSIYIWYGRGQAYTTIKGVSVQADSSVSI